MQWEISIHAGKVHALKLLIPLKMIRSLMPETVWLSCINYYTSDKNYSGLIVIESISTKVLLTHWSSMLFNMKCNFASKCQSEFSAWFLLCHTCLANWLLYRYQEEIISLFWGWEMLGSNWDVRIPATCDWQPWI